MVQTEGQSSYQDDGSPESPRADRSRSIRSTFFTSRSGFAASSSAFPCPRHTYIAKAQAPQSVTLGRMLNDFLERPSIRYCGNKAIPSHERGRSQGQLIQNQRGYAIKRYRLHLG